jgi:hypothetical protein
VRTGELWGKPGFGSAQPTVKAYFGELPEGEFGFEFFSLAEPSNESGPRAYFRERADGAVWLDGDWAKVKIVVSRVTQDF